MVLETSGDEQCLFAHTIPKFRLVVPFDSNWTADLMTVILVHIYDFMIAIEPFDSGIILRLTAGFVAWPSVVELHERR